MTAIIEEYSEVEKIAFRTLSAISALRCTDEEKARAFAEETLVSAIKVLVSLDGRKRTASNLRELAAFIEVERTRGHG